MPPPLWFRGWVHTRLRDRGWGGPNSDEGTDTVVRYVICGIYVCRSAYQKEEVEDEGDIFEAEHPASH